MPLEAQEPQQVGDSEMTSIIEQRGSFSGDLLSLAELDQNDLDDLLKLASAFKIERKRRKFIHKALGTSLALIFEKPSTRTRVSFEVAMFELGGHAVVLNARDMQLSRGESLEDTGETLSRFCQAISARVFSHQTLVDIAKGAKIPVINALSDLYHPCQTLADLQTIREVKGTLKGTKLAWIGDGDNVCNSLMIGAAASGMHMVVASPEKYEPLPEALFISKQKAKETGGSIDLTSEPIEAAKDADVIVTDTFVSMGQEDEKKERLQHFLPKYQVNDELMALAKPECIFMHCLPAHRGEEVTSSVIDGPQSVIWDETENRLHAQKAVLYTLLNSEK
jgi:ornithine carbamoyltransferase